MDLGTPDQAKRITKATGLANQVWRDGIMYEGDCFNYDKLHFHKKYN